MAPITSIFMMKAQGKDGNALCSLRMAYHLTKSESTTISLDLLDNCVGQSKSNSTMMFCARLSLPYYKKFVCLYLKTGHSHMISDRVVAWMQNSIRRKQMFIHLIFLIMNHINSVNACLLDHTGNDCNFFIGWDSLLTNTSRNFHLDSHIVTFLSLTFVTVRMKKQFIFQCAISQT